MSEREPDQDRQQQVIAVILKVVGIALAVGLAIGLGTWILVKALGLDSADTSGTPIQVDPIASPSSLPTTALPQPTPSGTVTDEPTETDEPTATSSPGAESLFLNASPVSVDPMQRINLTGQWPGRDNVSLLVQRFEDGDWVDFGVQVQVRVGTFETYVMTSHEGDNKFRVLDPETNTSSNEVTVTIGD